MKVSFSSQDKKDPESKGGLKVLYAPAKRNAAKLLWWSVLFFVSVPLLVLMFKIISGYLLTSSHGAITFSSYTVTATERGTVEAVFVAKSADVVSGETILRISRAVPAERLDQIAMLRAERNALLVRPAYYNPYPVVRAVRVDTRLINETISYLAKEVATYRHLMSIGAATRAEVNVAEAQLRAARDQKLQMLRAAIPAPSAPVTPVDDGSRTRIRYLDDTIRYLEGLPRSFDVIATDTGRISYVEVAAGENIEVGTPLYRISKAGSCRIVAYVEPKDFDCIKLGKKVKVVIPGTGHTINAVIDELPTVAVNIPGGLADTVLAEMRTVRVYLRALDPLKDNELIEGLPVRIDWGFRFSR